MELLVDILKALACIGLALYILIAILVGIGVFWEELTPDPENFGAKANPWVRYPQLVLATLFWPVALAYLLYSCMRGMGNLGIEFDAF
jgi:hypothetical protein